MINEDHELNKDHRGTAKDGNPNEADSGIEGLLGSSIGRMVSQYQAALRAGLDKEIEKIVDDFQKASVGSNETVAKRMRSRIEELVSEEVRRVFDNTLYGVKRSFADPIRARATGISGSDILRRGVSERLQGKRPGKMTRPGAAERHGRRSRAASHDRAPSPISPSVPKGYPSPNQSAADLDAAGPPQDSAYDDQAAPIGNGVPGPLLNRQGARGRRAKSADRPISSSPASPAAWVLPEGVASDEAAAPDADITTPSQYEPYETDAHLSQPAFSKPNAPFEPDDEVDPFVASLNDDLAPETDFQAADEYDEELDEEDTSELPDNALVAVLSDNTDLSTIAHDSHEIVHVISVEENPDVQAEASEADSYSAVVSTDDKYGDVAAVESVAPSPDVDTSPDGPSHNAAVRDDVAIPEAMEDADSSDDQAGPPNDEIKGEAETEPAVLQEFLHQVEEPAASLVDKPDDQATEDSSVAVQEAVETAGAANGDEKPDADEASEIGPDTARDTTNALSQAEGTDREQKTPQPASLDAPQEQPVQELPGSVEIVNEEGGDEELPESATFEGTVRLNVEAPGCIKEIVHFVRELRQKPELRLLRLVGNNKEGVDIWLGLREPLRIKMILPKIDGVSISVRPMPHIGGPDEKLLGIRMTRLVAAETVPDVS